MVQLKVIILGSSPAETLHLEEVLNQIGCLETFRYIGLEQALDRVPDWQTCTLLIARYQEHTAEKLLPLLASTLREGDPPVLFLVDSFEPNLVTRLMNAGARRVLPVDMLEELLEANLTGIFGTELPLVVPATKATSGAAVFGEEVSVAGEGDFFSVESFSRLFLTSPVGITINRLRDGICVDCNESFASLLEWPRQELIGRDSLDLGIFPDLQAYFGSDPTGGNGRSLPSMQLERKVYTRGRQIRHVQVHLDRIDLEGEPCVVSVVQDITEKEQAKEKASRLNDELERLVLVRTGALEAANRELAAEIGRRKVLEDFSNQLSQIIWETPDVVAIWAPDGRMQFLNKAGRALFGLSEDEPITGLDFFSAYSDEMRSHIHDTVQSLVVRDGIWRGETAFELPGERVIPLSQVLLCKKNETGEVQFFASIARDVSDFKRVEQELRQSRERYRTLAEAAHDFIFMVSRDGLMEYANEFSCQKLGFAPGEVEGIPASQFFPKDFAANHLQLFNEVHEIDRPVYTEGPFLLEDQEFWLGTWLVPIHNEQGSLVSILGISRDITEQKKTDEALQRALQNERKLNEMRSNFFSMTSHQFRTPLSTILLSVELLQKYGQRWDEQKRLEHLGRVQEAAKRLNSMLEDILVIGRAESGRYVCTPKEFDLISFSQETIRELSTNDQEEHPVHFQCAQPDLPVYQDPEVMHRVIDNLLSNAIKYSPKGSNVYVQVRTEDQHVLLEVSDEGIGIPEHDIMYLFQPFQRGSNAGDFPGTGIGLTIIQKSVELMNGSVSLRSKEGQGTTFIVRFPARYENTNRPSV